MSNTKESEKIYPKICPICGAETNFVNNVAEKEGVEALWYQCSCGVIFQKDLPKQGCYNTAYNKTYEISKGGRAEHSCRTYAPIIEELTYGRMMLDVGFATQFNLKAFEKRGWLTWGIDINKDLKGGGNIYKGDFMTYNFSPNISKEKLKELTGKDELKREFDLIWMNHVLEHFDNPLEALKKAYDLLAKGGVLYISTPDIDFIHTQGVSGWGHWRKNEHYIMWSERALNREAERVGFTRIMSRRNFASRYNAWFDIHAIYQKKYY